MDVNIVTRPEAVALFHPETGPRNQKHEVLTRLADLFGEAYGFDVVSVLDGLEQREALGSTGFGKGVAIPHCRSEQVVRPTLAILKLKTPCNFEAADAVPVTLVFGLVSPENAGATHLHALAAISRLMRDDAMLQALLNANDAEAIFALLTNQFLRDAA
ncbi:MAG: PTS sugar transporter subunit IIA [Pseudomonadota bacterium]